jgi:hypothetical protein
MLKFENITLDTETGNISGYYIKDASTSIDNVTKKEAEKAAKNGDPRPIGGAVPHSVKVTFDNVPLLDVIDSSVAKVVIRRQGKERKLYSDAKAFENGVLDKVLETKFVAERTTQKLETPEQFVAFAKAKGWTTEQLLEALQNQ